MLKEVIDLDPKYARAYALLGWTHTEAARYRWSKSQKESLSLAENYIQKALQIDDSESAAHLHLAVVYVIKRQFDKALVENERAISLDPNSVNIVQNNQRYWLLGSFHDFPNEILADFGGKCGITIGKGKYKNYQKPFGCAMLELHEESKGLLDRIVMASLASVAPEIYVGINHKYRIKVWFVQLYISPESANYVIQNFAQSPSVVKEKFGPIGLYLYRDILYNGDFKTTHNLTDFLNYIRSRRNK